MVIFYLATVRKPMKQMCKYIILCNNTYCKTKHFKTKVIFFQHRIEHIEQAHKMGDKIKHKNQSIPINIDTGSGSAVGACPCTVLTYFLPEQLSPGFAILG